jgi:hypothetical protein
MFNLRELAVTTFRGTPVEKPLRAVGSIYDGRRARRFNDWRAAYDQTSFAAQQAYYNELALRSPDQAQYDTGPVLDAVAGATTVVEIGGWRGDLARDALAAHAGISIWRNYDICTWALAHSKLASSRYEGIALTDWPWNTDLQSADALVATNMIEHIRFAELEQLARQFPKYGIVHLEAPVADDASDELWKNYRGTHILEVGWRQVEDLLVGLGFAPVRGTGWRTFTLDRT